MAKIHETQKPLEGEIPNHAHVLYVLLWKITSLYLTIGKTLRTTVHTVAAFDQKHLRKVQDGYIFTDPLKCSLHIDFEYSCRQHCSTITSLFHCLDAYIKASVEC